MVRVELQPTSTKRGGQTRRHLLSVATGLFASEGYRNVTIAKIANGVSISEPAIYRHFAGKEALATAVVNGAWEFFQETLASNLDGIDNTGARINALLDTEKSVYSRPEGKVFYMLVGNTDENLELQRRMREFLERKLELYQRISGNDYVAFRLSILIGIGCLAIVQGQQVFDAIIDELKKEFGAAASSDPSAPTERY